MLKKFAVLFLLAFPVVAQNYTISTVVGGGPSIGLNTLNYALHHPEGIAVDGAGNSYIALPDWCQVWVVNSSGILTQVIGTGVCGYSGDNGSPAAAQLNNPWGVTVDSTGANIYIADTFNNVIRKISGGTITTIAGTGVYGYNQDGIAATSAELAHPRGISLDNNGNYYIADEENCRVRKVTGTTISTFAGSSQTCGYNGDGMLATAAYLNAPFSVAVDATGSNVYIADRNNNRIREVSVSSGMISTVAGNGTAGYAEGTALAAVISAPQGVAVDSAGNFYIADTGNGRLREVSNGTISTLASGLDAQAVVLSGSNFYVADTTNDRIAKVAGSSVTTVAGNGTNAGGDGSLATSAVLAGPAGIAMDAAGDIFIADEFEGVIRKVAAGTGIITTVAGTGATAAGSESCLPTLGDGGPATSANLCRPWGVAVDSTGTVIYIADSYNHRIRKVSNGIINTIAGTGTGGYNGDGVALQSELNIPGAIALDPSGNLYIADTDNCLIRKLTGTTISTFAGVTAGTPGYCNGNQNYNGDGIAPTSAFLDGPTGVFVDSTGNNVYIADEANCRIRKVSSGSISTVAGTGTCSYGGDGAAATSAQLYNPYSVILDSLGNMYISDSHNVRVRKVSPSGTINTIAGNGTPGFSGDGGSATNAQLNGAWGLVLDSNMNVYVADTGNGRIRELTGSPTCTYSLSPTSVGAVAGASSSSFMVNTSSGCTWSASSNSGFLTVTSGSSGTGTGTVGYNVLANGLAEGQTGAITVTGQNFSQNYTVTQAGQGCQVTLTPSSLALGASGTAGSNIGVGLSGSDCQWTASTNVPSWVTITSGSSGTGNGTVSYTAASNALSSVGRGGAININVSTISTQAAFNLTEGGTACSYSLAQSSQSFLASGGSGSVSIVAPGGCNWTLSGVPSWVTISSGSSGTGNGSVNYTVQSNSSTVSRSATLTIAGQSYVITQSGVTMTLSCAVTVPSVPQVAREGRTEVLGNLVLTCTGLTSAITADVVLTLNTIVTNVVTSGTSTAMLTTGGTSQGGQVLGYTTVHWPGITLTPSGGTAVVTLSNLQADASLLAGGANLSITGQLSLNSGTLVPVTNSNPTLATVATSLAFQANPTTTSGTQTTLPLLYQETSAGSFHVAAGNTPATRLRMVISNVPDGVQVYAPLGGAQFQLYGTDCSGGGGTAVTTGINLSGATYALLPVSGGVATATWVVLSVDTNIIDTLTIPLVLVNPSQVSLNSIQVEGSLAPVSPAGTACASAPNPDPTAGVVPRYRDFSVPQTLVNLRLTTSLTLSTGTGILQYQVPEKGVGRGRAELAKTELRLSPLGAQPSVTVGFGATLANESTSQTLTHGKVGGSAPTGSNQMSCTATGGGTCTAANGQYNCSWPSVGPGQSVSCSGSGALDPSYQPGATVTNSAGANGDQTPADTTTVESSSSAILPVWPTLQIVSPVNSAAATGTVMVTGWVADLNYGIGSVTIQVDDITKGSATFGTPDPTVCANYQNYTSCGDFSYSLNTLPLTSGNHVITATVQDTRQPSLLTVSAPVTITVPVGGNQTATITGNVSISGSIGNGVTIDVNGSQTTSVTTDLSGNYSVTLPLGGSYTLSASRIGYSFSGPAAVQNLSGNQTVTFIGTPVPGLEFYPITPCRLVDTRVSSFQSGFGPPTMAAKETRTFSIPSNNACGIPSTAAAYSLNVTVVTQGYLGYLSIWQAGQPIPNVSTLNSYSMTSTAVANAAIVPAGTNGAISVYVTDATDLIIDIDGYFAPPATNGLEFYTVTPCRLVDTRVGSFQSGFGPPTMTAGGTRTFPIPSDAACGIPSTAAAYSLNVTAVPKTTLGFLSIWPTGKPLPNVSTLNVYTAGTVVANAAIVPAGTGGAINVYVTDLTDVVIDINGYFAPPASNGLKLYPATPCRVADTRVATFPAGLGTPTMAAGTTRSFAVPQSTCGIPAGAGAYSFNFTAVPKAPQLGIFITWPTGQPQPNVSTMNSYNGSVVANAAIVPAGNNGAISIYVTDLADVLFDIDGYFAP